MGGEFTGGEERPVQLPQEFSSILCVADNNVTGALDQCLTDLALPEVFVQRAKQMSLADKSGLFGLRPVSGLEEARAMIYRIYVPSKFETGIMQRIAEATDLRIGGRGSIFAQHADFHRGAPLSFDTEKLERLCGTTEKLPQEQHTLLSCVVPRGQAASLAEAVLELGVCVPVVFYGEGMGLRDKLGLLRITIPKEKEVIWFIVPNSDADLVEKTLIPRARLDIPGRGFLYKLSVYAPVVNLRIRHSKRTHAATMEQVIAALDEVRGSSDWRRLESRKHGSGGMQDKTAGSRGLFFIGDEEDVEIFRLTAMESGARGATFNTLEMRSYQSRSHEEAMKSHSRSLCDIIVSREVEERILENTGKTGLFDEKKSCVLKTFTVEMPSAIRR
jgi:hypothetical protein